MESLSEEASYCQSGILLSLRKRVDLMSCASTGIRHFIFKLKNRLMTVGNFFPQNSLISDHCPMLPVLHIGSPIILTTLLQPSIHCDFFIYFLISCHISLKNSRL